MIKNKISITFLSLLTFLVASGITVSTKTMAQETPNIMQRLEIKNQKQNILETNTTTTPQLLRERLRIHKDSFEAEKERLKQQIRERKEEFENRVQEMREMKKQEIEAKKQEFKEKLSQIKEERKKITTERISENINKVNQFHSDAELRHLDAIELVLNKIELRTKVIDEKTETDLTQIYNKIAEVKTRIEDARTTILNQKSKEYIIEFGSEETLGQNIREIIQQLKSDHRKIREEVLRNLREEVRNALQLLKEAVQGINTNSNELLNQDINESNESQN